MHFQVIKYKNEKQDDDDDYHYIDHLLMSAGTSGRNHLLRHMRLKPRVAFKLMDRYLLSPNLI